MLCCLLIVLMVGNAHALFISNRESETCSDRIVSCLQPAISPYAELNQEQILEKIRDTALSRHCGDWRAVAVCLRGVLNGEVCAEEASEKELRAALKSLELLEWVVNYACSTNFDKVSRNIRCLATTDVLENTIKSCLYDELAEDCDKIRENIECTTSGVTAKCNAEAGSVWRDVYSKYKYIVAEAVGRDCSSHSAPSANQIRLALLRRYIFSK